jgi:photosystem II stability/assembly factor-like uncharacterized protein
MTRHHVLVAAVLLCLAAGATSSVAEDEPAPSPSASASAAPTPSPGPMDALAWRNVGPAVAGGRLAAIAGSDRDPALVYIGAAGGGVWKSTNATTSWKPVFDKEGVGSIGAIAIDPNDSADVWVGTGESNPRNDVSYGNGVYRSIDGGKTWSALGLRGSYAISKISLDPRNRQIAVVAALGDPFRDSDDRGVYRTVDGGKTWTKTLGLAPDSGAADLDRSAKEPDVLFAAMWQFRRSSWHLRSGGDADGLFKSTDGGASWKRVSGGGFAEGTTGRIGVAVAPSDPKRVYALVESAAGILWRSNDAGATWQLVSTNTLIDERPFYYTRIAVDPQNEDHLFAVSVKLAQSKDGGKTWAVAARHVHGDHHAIWFSADGRTVLDGNDGGPAVSRDGGATFEWRNNVPIGQIYRVAADDRVPYGLCAGLQDNGSWCGPSDDRSDDGILPADWTLVSGGDGNWTLADPMDPDWVWSSSGGGDNQGELDRYNLRTRLSLDVSPYVRNQNVVAPSELQYRFNWEAPLAFSPFDGRIAYYGGNVLFRTTDGGLHWTPISPDLTRDIVARQGLTGTPLRLDVTGAESYDTLLDVVPSTVAAGQIWITTDDGKVQLTRDGGAHWRDVTMPQADADARIPTLAASAGDAATAYTVVDRHFTGDRAPYVYVTRDFGRSWSPIVAGLPRDQFAHAIAEDPGHPNVLFLGLENSVWWSPDRGANWYPLQQNLPPVSVRDLRIPARRHDLVAGTHGRGIWILDDLTPLENWRPGANAVALFAPPPAYAFAHATPSVNAIAAGDGPAGPALFTFYLPHPAATRPSLDVVDPSGRIVRHLSGTHDVDDEDVPVVSNVAGFNRVAWDLTADPPVRWLRAPKWNRGPESGPDLLPGTYRVRLHVDDRSYEEPLEIRADPRAAQAPAQWADHVAYLAELYGELTRIDAALNELDNLELQLPDRIAALAAAKPAAADLARDALTEAERESATLSSHPVNGQDNDFLRDLLRERVQSLIGIATTLSPTEAQRRESAALRAELEPELDRHTAFMRERIAPLQAELTGAGLKPVDLGATPPPPKAGERVDEHGSKSEDD